MQRVALGAVVLVLLASVAVPATGPVGAASAGAGDGFRAPGSIDADDVLMRIRLQPDGDATWVVEYRVRLATDNETAAFEELMRDVRSNRSGYVSEFATGIRATVAAAENATGREMRATNVTVSAEKRQLPKEYGVVTYRFHWSNFAAVDGDRVVAGDALEGLFLDGSTTLRVSWVEGYDLVAASPEPSANRTKAVVWYGPVSFATGEPRVVVAPAGRTGAGSFPVVPTLGGVVVLAVLAAAWYYYRHGGAPAPAPAPGPSDGDGDGDGGEAADRSATAGEASTGEPDAGSGGSGEPPAELLSNEERVIRLLERNGGRVKQQEVVGRLDWTEAKTSQVVNKMKDEGQIDVFRIGRENVLRLPDEDAMGDGEESGDAE